MKYNEVNLLEFLKKYFGESVVYCSNPGNAGDALIAHSTYALFAKAGVNIESILANQQVKNSVVFYGGGGNLVEGKYLDAYNFLKNNIGNNKEIILLPHTVYGFDDFLLSAKNLTIFCREKVSYDYLATIGFSKERLFLAHDTAFAIDESDLQPYIKEGKGIANCFRRDSESNNIVNIPEDNIDISLCWNGELWHNHKFAAMVTYSLASYLSEFAVVKTDRLHVAILGALLKKKVLMYPNNYYKNRAVFEYSLQDNWKNVTFLGLTDIKVFENLKNENKLLIKEVNQLKLHLTNNLNQIDLLKLDNSSILNSNSWKITKPLRAIKSLFSRS